MGVCRMTSDVMNERERKGRKVTPDDIRHNEHRADRSEENEHCRIWAQTCAQRGECEMKV